MSGAKGVAIIVTTMLFCFAPHINTAHAVSYTVGDNIGWSFSSVRGWPKGKNFKAGDTLLFKYDHEMHNVVVVDKKGYDTCSVLGAKVYNSGNDQIKLDKGVSYYICGIPGHCTAGMKMVVTAT